MKKRLIFGLEARLFALIFLVASFISLGVAVYIYDQEKDLTEQALADELLRAAHVFAASLNPDDVAQLPYEAPNSSLVQQYRNLAQRIVDEAGVVYAYTCSPSGTGRCRFGVVSNDLVTGDVYAYSETFAAEAWEAVLSGEAAVSPIFRDEYGEWMSALVPIRDAGGRVVALAGVDFEASHVRKALQEQMRQVWLLGVSMVVVWLIVALVISRTIVRPVTNALGRFGVLVERVADGDLTMDELPVRSSDEVGRLSRAFNEMVGRLRELMRSVTASSNAVLAAAEELSSASEQAAEGAKQAADAVAQMATGAHHQSTVASEVQDTMQQLQAVIAQIAAGAERTAGEVQQSAELMDTMMADIALVADQAIAVTEGAVQAAESARNGRVTMQQTVEGMERIREAVDHTAAQMRDLAQLSTQIGEINQLISEIAEQTNLLALNAAIEAARAGEHGRGFAVVAEEVRRLAERSAASANEIDELIRNTQNRTADAVQAMESGLKEVANGAQLAHDADRALADILQLVENAVNGIQQISTASAQLRSGAERVAAAFNEVATVTEQNTAATEEMAASASMVDDHVDRLTALSHDNASAAEEGSASVEELTAMAAQVSDSAEELTRIASSLREQVQRFRV